MNKKAGFCIKTSYLIDTTPDLIEKGSDRLQIVSIFINDGQLQLHYHKMLEEQCNLTDEIMNSELAWLYDYLTKKGFVMKNVFGSHSAVAISMESENATDVSFFAAVNLKLLDEQEGIEIANHFVKFFTKHRIAKQKGL